MNVEFQLSEHTKDMLKERKIQEEWIWRTLEAPDWQTSGSDANLHHFKQIPEHGGRVLHAVVNPYGSPKRVVTAFFDRRARREA